MGGHESSQKGEHSSMSSQKLNRQSQLGVGHFFSAVLSDGGDSVTRSNFVAYFPAVGRTLAQRLFTHLSSSSPELQKQQCSESLSKIMMSASTSNLNRTFVEMFCGNGRLCHQDVADLLQSSLTLFLTSMGLSPHCSEADNAALSTVASLLTSRCQVSSAADWIDDNCPELFTVMHRCLVGWLRGEEKSTSMSVVGEDVHKGRLLCKAWWWILQSSLSSVFISSVRNKTRQEAENSTREDNLWNLLYSSQDHGLSTNRLQHHVFGYRGPTLMLLSCDGGYTYAVALDTEWREGTQSWGGSSCCVFRLSPDVKKLEEGDNMIQFNDRSRNAPRGICIGRNSKNRVLRLKEGLEIAEHNHTSSSVHTLEVWGCGDSGIRTAQAKQKKVELRDAEKAAKVKLPGQWDDSPDKLLLEWGGVKVNHAEQFTRD